MEKNPKISIVVPVYNVEQYLRKCLDSLINQTIQDIEIIIINDCSTDNSQEIIEEYLQKDKRIKSIIHPKNLGLGAARNTGIALAKGDFIGFIDSDDWVELGMFEKLLQACESTKAEIAVCGFVREKKEGKIVEKWQYSSTILQKSDYLKHFSALIDWPIACNKLFKSSVIRENLFIFATSLVEDLPTIVPWMLRAQKIVFIPEILYHYRIRAGLLNGFYTHLAKLKEGMASFSLLNQRLLAMQVDAEILKAYQAWWVKHHWHKLMYQNRLNILNIGFQRKYFDILKNNMEENGIVFSDIAPYFTAQEKGVHYFFNNSFWKMYVLKAFVLSFLSVKAKIKKKLGDGN